LRRLVWTKPAKLDFDRIWDWLEALDAAAAQRNALRLTAAAERLTKYPFIGHPGRLADTREFSVSRSRYILVYGVSDVAVTIYRVLHERQQWPPTESR
jgi:toxin ParE1/3/4